MTTKTPKSCVSEEKRKIPFKNVKAIRKLATQESFDLDARIIAGKVNVTGIDPADLMRDIRTRYKNDPYEIGFELKASPINKKFFDYYNSAELAELIAGMLIDAGITVVIERLDKCPPFSMVIVDSEGRTAWDHTGPVWVIKKKI